MVNIDLFLEAELFLSFNSLLFFLVKVHSIQLKEENIGRVSHPNLIRKGNIF